LLPRLHRREAKIVLLPPAFERAVSGAGEMLVRALGVALCRSRNAGKLRNGGHV